MTLWLGGIDECISEIDIRDHVYAYGWIISIHISRAGSCAFVEFANREMAENAARQLYNALSIRGKSIAVNWSKGRASAVAGAVSDAGEGPAAAPVMLPPPGMERAPVSAYSIMAHKSTSASSSSGGSGGVGTAEQPVSEQPPAESQEAEDSSVAGEKRPASDQLSKPPRPPVYPSTDPTRLGTS